MSGARSDILGRIRRALVDVPADEDPSTDGIARDYRERAASGDAALAESFALALAHYGVRIGHARRNEVAQRVGEMLTARGLTRIVVADDFPAEFEPAGAQVIRDRGLDYATIAAADGSVTTCALGIAQTGTILLDHSNWQGRRVLSLLPDYQLCLIEASQIVALVPEAVARSHAALHAGRPLTFVSGPSATSDIELNRVPGVHGPRTLDVLLIRDAAPEEKPAAAARRDAEAAGPEPADETAGEAGSAQRVEPF